MSLSILNELVLPALPVSTKAHALPKAYTPHGRHTPPIRLVYNPAVLDPLGDALKKYLAPGVDRDVVAPRGDTARHHFALGSGFGAGSGDGDGDAPGHGEKDQKDGQAESQPQAQGHAGHNHPPISSAVDLISVFTATYLSALNTLFNDDTPQGVARNSPLKGLFGAGRNYSLGNASIISEASEYRTQSQDQSQSESDAQSNPQSAQSQLESDQDLPESSPLPTLLLRSGSTPLALTLAIPAPSLPSSTIQAAVELVRAADVVLAGGECLLRSRMALPDGLQGRSAEVLGVLSLVCPQFHHPDLPYVILTNHEHSVLFHWKDAQTIEVSGLVERAGECTDQRPVGNLFALLLGVGVLRLDAYGVPERE